MNDHKLTERPPKVRYGSDGPSLSTLGIIVIGMISSALVAAIVFATDQSTTGKLDFIATATEHQKEKYFDCMKTAALSQNSCIRLLKQVYVEQK